MNVRAGHDSYWNSHAGFSGTYASQFAVTGLGAVKGAADELAGEIRKLAAGVLGADGPDDIVLEGGFAKRRDNPEAALPFMAVGAIVNANNAVLPEEARAGHAEPAATSTCRRSRCRTRSASTAT